MAPSFHSFSSPSQACMMGVLNQMTSFAATEGHSIALYLTACRNTHRSSQWQSSKVMPLKAIFNTFINIVIMELYS